MRLARLGQFVLELEQNDVGDLTEVIAEVFREVHTLKGSAAVVGFEDVAAIRAWRRGETCSAAVGIRCPNASIVDALLVAVDRLGR